MSGQESVKSTVRVLLSTLSPVEKVRLIRELTAESAPAEVEDRIIHRKETGRLLGRSARAVDYMAAEGLLHKVKFPGRSRGAGFQLSEVRALIGGKG